MSWCTVGGGSSCATIRSSAGAGCIGVHFNSTGTRMAARPTASPTGKLGVARLDVGVDAQAMAPVSIEELLAFWEEKHRPDGYWGRIKPAEIRLEMTCAVCPEQYDVFDKNGQYLGYLHLRGGSFQVNCLRPGDEFEETISEYCPAGWVEFESERERSAYLSIARRDIAEFFRKLEQSPQGR